MKTVSSLAQTLNSLKLTLKFLSNSRIIMLHSNKKIAYVAGLSIVEKLLEKFPEAMLFGGALRDKILHHSVTAPIIRAHQAREEIPYSQSTHRQLMVDYHFAMEDASITPKNWDIYVPTASMASDVKFYLRTEEQADIHENDIHENASGSFSMTRNLLVTSIKIMALRHSSSACVSINLVCPTIDNTPLGIVDCDVNSLSMKGDGVVYSRLFDQNTEPRSVWNRFFLIDKISSNIKEKIFEPLRDQGEFFTREKKNQILSRFGFMIRTGWKCMVTSENEGTKYYQKNDNPLPSNRCEECFGVDRELNVTHYFSISFLMFDLVKVSHEGYEGKDGNTYTGVYTFCHIGCMNTFANADDSDTGSESESETESLSEVFHGEFSVYNGFDSDPVILPAGSPTFSEVTFSQVFPIQPTIELIQPTIELIQPTIELIQPSGSEQTEGHLCIVCMDNQRNVVFLPCSHFALCTGCSSNVRSCPTCRQSITSRIQVFVP